MKSETNINEPERWISVVIGTAVAAYGLKRRSIPGFVVASIGGALIWRGATGHCLAYEILGVTTAEQEDDDRQVSVPYGKGVPLEKRVTINAPPEDPAENVQEDLNRLKTLLERGQGGDRD